MDLFFCSAGACLRQISNYLIKQIVMLKRKKVTLNIIHPAVCQCGISFCLFNRIPENVKTVHRLRSQCAVPLNQKRSNAAKRIKYLCMLFQPRSGQLCTQCRIDRIHGRADTFHAIGKSLIRDRIQFQKSSHRPILLHQKADLS